MASYNKVVVVGNLTRDVELKTLSNGTSVGEFGLAINDSYIDKSTGDKVDTPVFLDVTVWARQAETAAQYIGKGSQVLVDGKLKLDIWETDDGDKRQKLRVVANQIQFLSKQADGSSVGPYNQDNGDESVNQDNEKYLDAEEIPF